MDARSALFDLYGDHLRSRGSQAPVAALVRLLAPLGITAPAVRTAVSRMARQGWLQPVRLPEGAGYELSPRANRRMDETGERIYRLGDPSWDGRWHVVVVERVRDRGRRDRLRAAMRFLGYAPVDETAWIAPRPSRELEALLEAERVRAERFVASYDGDPRGLVARAWDLDGVRAQYEQLIIRYSGLRPLPGDPLLLTHIQLVNEWQRFPFLDPQLPEALLPNWIGHRAAVVFTQLRAQWYEDAQARWREVVKETAPS